MIKNEISLLKKDIGIVNADDEPQIVDLLSVAMEFNGYKKPYSAYNGTEAYDLIKKLGAKINILIIDDMMPGPRGIEVYEALVYHRKFPLAVIMHNGEIVPDHFSRFWKNRSKFVKPVDFIEVPIPLKRLAKMIETAHRLLLDNVLQTSRPNAYSVF